MFWPFISDGLPPAFGTWALDERLKSKIGMIKYLYIKMIFRLDVLRKAFFRLSYVKHTLTAFKQKEYRIVRS